MKFCHKWEIKQSAVHSFKLSKMQLRIVEKNCILSALNPLPLGGKYFNNLKARYWSLSKSKSFEIHLCCHWWNVHSNGHRNCPKLAASLLVKISLIWWRHESYRTGFLLLGFPKRIKLLKIFATDGQLLGRSGYVRPWMASKWMFDLSGGNCKQQGDYPFSKRLSQNQSRTTTRKSHWMSSQARFQTGIELNSTGSDSSKPERFFKTRVWLS